MIRNSRCSLCTNLAENLSDHRITIGSKDNTYAFNTELTHLIIELHRSGVILNFDSQINREKCVPDALVRNL